MLCYPLWTPLQEWSGDHTVTETVGPAVPKDVLQSTLLLFPQVISRAKSSSRPLKTGFLSGFLLGALANQGFGHGQRPWNCAEIRQTLLSDPFTPTLPERLCRSPVAKVVIDLPSPSCAFHRRHRFCLSGNYETSNTTMNGYWCLLVFKEFEEKSHLIFIGCVSILWVCEQLIENKSYEVTILVFP